ncbi:hypothetical protein [Streptomyces fuscichromogenes]|uniref:Uncharacterized protein n=1 Tax=Streptomyces fuscichromogenes TaxID=1324013 RepID=A0A917XNA3_9ACTN|nr:hypothetical protein [Streptomyces fuscichromogenes]GGN40887.1 hypothetical protein GCM10011578_088580 [Streptomyces fuscichromogenes]
MPNHDVVNLSQIARMAGVGRAAVVNWRRRHGGLDATGGTAESPTFPLAAAEQWLRALGRLPQATPAEPATLTFEGGQMVTAYVPDLRVPGPGDRYDRYEEFGGYIAAEGRDGIPWPRASVRIDVPGQTPYEVTDANVDISYAGGTWQYLSLTWPAPRRQLLAITPTTTPTKER